MGKGYSITGRVMGGSNLFTGTLDLLILRTLAAGPLHGYAVGKHIRDTSEGILDVEEGALYPALHRLERKKLLTSDWGRTETGRRAKFYRLTPLGQEELDAEARRWTEHADAVRTVLGPSGGRA